MPFNPSYLWQPLPKEKWLPDAAAKFCQMVDRNTLRRCPTRLICGNRHHCRECGLLICTWHSRYRYQGHRVCDRCYRMLINYNLCAIKIQKAFRRHLDSVSTSQFELYRLANKLGVKLQHFSQLKYDEVYLQAYEPEREPSLAHSVFYASLKDQTIKVEVFYNLQCDDSDIDNEKDYYKYYYSSSKLPTLDRSLMQNQIANGRIYRLNNITESMLTMAVQETIRRQSLQRGRSTNHELVGYSCNLFTVEVLKRLVEKQNERNHH